MIQHIRHKAAALAVAAALSTSFAQEAAAKDAHTITAGNHKLQVSCSRDFNRGGQPTLALLQRLDRFIHEVKNMPSHGGQASPPSYVLVRRIRGHGGGGMLDGITAECMPGTS